MEGDIGQERAEEYGESLRDLDGSSERAGKTAK